MLKCKWYSAVIPFVLLVTGAHSASAFGITSCTDTKTGVTINGDVVVPANQTCTLLNSTVRGNVYALQNSQLFTDNGTQIRGTVRGEGSQAISIISTTVGRNVIQRGGKNSNFHIDSSAIAGNVRFENNGPYEFLQIFGTAIAGDLIIRRNHVWSHIDVENTAIKGDVKLFDNNVANPTPKDTVFLFLNNDVIFGSLLRRNNRPGPQITNTVVFGDSRDNCGRDRDDDHNHGDRDDHDGRDHHGDDD